MPGGGPGGSSRALLGPGANSNNVYVSDVVVVL